MSAYLYEPAANEPEYDENEPEAYDPLEAARDRRSRLRPASPRPSYTPPPPSPTQYVTQAQLQAGFAGVRADMVRNARAIDAEDTRIDSLRRQVRQEDRRLRDDFRNSTQMLALLPLLIRPRSLTVTGDVEDTEGEVAIPGGTRLQQDTDGFSAILPLVLIMGMGGFGGGGQQGGQDMMLPLILLFALRP